MIEKKPTDVTVVSLTLAGILAISLLLQHEFSLRQSLLFLIGIGLGISLLHATFGFTGGWRFFIRDRNSMGIRAQILLLGVTSFLFFPIIGNDIPGVIGNAAAGQAGISVIVGAFLFGMGMQLGGGCGSGTLYTVGYGYVDMLITLTFFIIGATLGSAHLHWWLATPNAGIISIIADYGWLPSLLVQLMVLLLLYIVARFLDQRRNQNLKPMNFSTGQSFMHRLVFGPWPIVWGVVGLAIFNLLTMLVAGHPWTITFAFGLWGTKIWSALGGDISGWQYWNSGYPANAINSSVLADTTSIMDFGIVLGAMLAAALAGHFAPTSKINGKRVLTAVVGGLCLGYGARLAFGCNIGGMLAGITTGSLHGWLWLLAAFPGAILGLYLKSWMGIDKPMGRRTA
jgi:uncharacterized membrane protein YedE/YeeE